MVSSLFKNTKDWKEDHPEEAFPVITEENDPQGWIAEVSNQFVYCPEDFCKFYRVSDEEIIPAQPSYIDRDDCPYAFESKNRGGVAGVKISTSKNLDGGCYTHKDLSQSKCVVLIKYL